MRVAAVSYEPMHAVVVGSDPLTTEEIVAVAREGAGVILCPDAENEIEASRKASTDAGAAWAQHR